MVESVIRNLNPNLLLKAESIEANAAFVADCTGVGEENNNLGFRNSNLTSIIESFEMCL